MTINTDLLQTADWLKRDPGMSDALSVGALERISEALMEMGLTCSRAGHSDEFRCALLKMLAMVRGGSVFKGTDEDVFALSKRIQREIYFEIMALRRSVSADVELLNEHG